MRHWMVLACLLLVAAKGKKKTEEPVPVPVPVETPAAPAEPEPPPLPPEPVKPKNASFSITFSYADGTTKSGKVTGIERAVDFNGDEGWTSEEGKLKLSVEVGATEKAAAWSDVKSITIVPGKMPDDVDCTYSSDFTPWMYECTLRTTAVVVLKDGSKGNINTRNLWKFYFEDGSDYTFQVYKYTVREQDTKVAEYGDDQAENMGLYTKLQDQLRTEMKGKMIKGITLQ